jgi:DNA-binding NarL/FixJ family response regulator
MPAEALSDDPTVAVVDVMEFRRALVVHFLKDWAATKNVELLSLVPEQAHAVLREGIACKMIIFNAGAGSCASPDTISEIRVLRALAPAASLVVMADEESRDDVFSVMQNGAEGYLSNQSAPDLVLRALSFVLEGGTYFPRSAVALAPFSGGAPLRAVREASSAEFLATGGGALPTSDAGQSSPNLHLSKFSRRQKAILDGLCRGEPNKIIGRALNLPESTVKVHVREIMRKLSVSNRTQVAVVVSRMGGRSPGPLGEDAQSGEPLNAEPSLQAPPICPDAPAEAMKPPATNDASLHGAACRKNTCVDLPPVRAVPLGFARHGVGESLQKGGSRSLDR